MSSAFFDVDEVEVLKSIDSAFEVEVKVWGKGHEEVTLRALVLGSQFAYKHVHSKHSVLPEDGDSEPRND